MGILFFQGVTEYSTETAHFQTFANMKAGEWRRWNTRDPNALSGGLKLWNLSVRVAMLRCALCVTSCVDTHCCHLWELSTSRLCAIRARCVMRPVWTDPYSFSRPLWNPLSALASRILSYTGHYWLASGTLANWHQLILWPPLTNQSCSSLSVAVAWVMLNVLSLTNGNIANFLIGLVFVLE